MKTFTRGVIISTSTPLTDLPNGVDKHLMCLGSTTTTYVTAPGAFHKVAYGTNSIILSMEHIRFPLTIRMNQAQPALAGGLFMTVWE